MNNRKHDPYNLHRWADEKPGMFQSWAQAILLLVGGIVCTAGFFALAIVVLSLG